MDTGLPDSEFECEGDRFQVVSITPKDSDLILYSETLNADQLEMMLAMTEEKYNAADATTLLNYFSKYYNPKKIKQFVEAALQEFGDSCPRCNGKTGYDWYPDDDPTNSRQEGGIWKKCPQCVDRKGSVWDCAHYWAGHDGAADLLRDIVGPFRMIKIQDGNIYVWRLGYKWDVKKAYWLTPTVLSLAKGADAPVIDNDALLVLSDALEEAGCDNQEILNHLRDGKKHYRGMWSLELLL